MRVDEMRVELINDNCAAPRPPRVAGLDVSATRECRPVSSCSSKAIDGQSLPGQDCSLKCLLN
jgi:hypothetical protein